MNLLNLIRVNILKFILFISLLVTIPNGIANAVTTDVIPLSTDLGTIYTEEQIQSLVDVYSKQYGVSSAKMMQVIKCESQYRNVQSNHVRNGIREDSWGIVQIYLPAHPNITKEQALDPYFSVEFMAEKFSKGWTKWTCYK